MKKDRHFFMALLGMVVAIGMVVTGCDNGNSTTTDNNGGGNPLDGTWSYFNEGQIKDSITFSSSNYDWKEAIYGGLITVERGTYSVSGSTITFQPTKGSALPRRFLDRCG
jgi:hypothetical protein